MLAAAIQTAAPIAVAGVLALPLILGTQAGRSEEAVAIPPPALDEAVGPDGLRVAVFAGGCFWGVQAVYQHVEGVENAVSGYAGGQVADPTYKQVTRGNTGHAESVEITYDPAKVSYGQLLQVFFSVAHDPTQLNRQGPDIGTQYRSAIFYRDEEQKRVAEAYIRQLGAASLFPAAIVTEVAPLDRFYAAEDYHQDYAFLHPDQPYIIWNDLPKVANLKEIFPALWRDEPKLVFARNRPS
jgi:peptide-methionine (S)-S-oxide reductase